MPRDEDGKCEPAVINSMMRALNYHPLKIPLKLAKQYMHI